MADPLSISTSILAITGACLQSAQFLNRLRDVYKDSEMTISAMCSECTVMSASLAQIQTMILRRPPDQSTQLQSIHATFETALTGCMVIMSVLEKEIRGLLAQDEEIGYKTSIKLVWKEGRMKELLDHLRGQQTGLSLLMQLLEMESLETIQQTVMENTATLEQLKTRTLSIRSANPDISTPESIFDVDVDVRTITKSRAGLDNESSIGSSTFDFDDQIVNSFAYRRALVSLQLGAKTRAQSMSKSQKSHSAASERGQPYHAQLSTVQTNKNDSAQLVVKWDLCVRIKQLISDAKYDQLEHLWMQKDALNLIDLDSSYIPDEPKITSSQGTLLHQAAFQGNTELAQWLLMHGANPYRRDIYGRLPEDMTGNKPSMYRFLRESPASIVAKTMLEKRCSADRQFDEFSGCLEKWETFEDCWRLRWFVLEDGVLSIYCQDGPKTICYGAMHMSIVELFQDSKDGTKFEVRETSPVDGRQETRWKLKAYDYVERSIWYLALSNSIEQSRKDPIWD